MTSGPRLQTNVDQQALRNIQEGSGTKTDGKV